MNIVATPAATDTLQAQSENIYADITQLIGHTPLVQLSRFADHLSLQAEVIGKVEYFNPTGSVKDRSAFAMIEALEADGKLQSDTEIVEASSGNNGVACAWAGALRNIPVTIVMPEHMSIERRKLMKHFGAAVVLTPKALGTKGAIDEAERLLSERPNAIVLGQFSNPANVKIHAETTAAEIWRDTGGRVDAVIAGIGTGGTFTGIATALKSLNPCLHMVAVEPASCPVLSEGRAGVHNIQGLSSGHVPDILDTDLIDEIITVIDEDALHYARLAAAVEGLPIGISSGAALKAMHDVASRPDMKDKRIVAILADGACRYFSTDLFLDGED